MERASGVAGSVAGAAVGSIGGLEGMAAGALAGQFVPEVLAAAVREFRERVLSPRERERTDRVLAQIAEEVSARVAAGEAPRSDWFEEGDRDGVELMEGVALVASREYRERKQPFIARFYASLVFRPDVSGAQAEQLLAIIGRMTWRQVVAVAAVARRLHVADAQDLFRQRAAQGGPVSDGMLEEMDDLADLGVWGHQRNPGEVVRENTWNVNDYLKLGAQDAHRIALRPLGVLLNDLMGLDAIPEDECRPVVRSIYGLRH